MNHRRRVVVTGLGVVAPKGTGKEAFWRNLVAGTSAVAPISLFDASPYPCRVGAEATDFRPEAFMLPARVKHRGRFSQLAVAAAKLAVQDACLNLQAVRAEHVRIAMGTSMSGIGDITEGARLGFDRAGFEGIPIVSGLEFAAHAPVSHISSELRIQGTSSNPRLGLHDRPRCSP